MTTVTTNFEEKHNFEIGGQRHKDGTPIVTQLTRSEFQALKSWNPSTYRCLFAADFDAYKMRCEVEG